MKLSKKPNDIEKRAVQKLKEIYPEYEELASLSISWMNALSILIQFIANNYSDNVEFLPEQTRYGMALGVHHLKLFQEVVTGKIKPGNVTIKHVPFTERSYDHPEHLSDKMVLMIKVLYEDLKKDGRI